MFIRIFSIATALLFGFGNVSAQGYNPCENIPTQIAVDSVVGMVVGGLLHGRNGAKAGTGAALGVSYAARSYECQQWRRDEFSRQQEEQRRATELAREEQRRQMEEARRNAPQCDYQEVAGKQTRTCREHTYEGWRQSQVRP
ncbi:MAG: hypothetical protein Q8O53_03850 [Candidatus Moranbacteria bacterium]|nr:hypothetical protein [Candidatus Moranbacteria bacterium]